jgi:hypothetical protein
LIQFRSAWTSVLKHSLFPKIWEIRSSPRRTIHTDKFTGTGQLPEDFALLKYVHSCNRGLSMRHARIRGEGLSDYHCRSRVIKRRFIPGDEARECLVALMLLRKLEAFPDGRVVSDTARSYRFRGEAVSVRRYGGRDRGLPMVRRRLGRPESFGSRSARFAFCLIRPGSAVRAEERDFAPRA